jgi:hypothetical protein
MKTFYGFISSVCFFVALVSCEYLDVVPDNIATVDNAFADRYTTEQFLGACYWGAPRSAGWNENPGIFGAMEMVFNKEGQNEGGMLFGLGNNNPTNPRIDYWSGNGVRSLYAAIRDCNTFMENVGGVRDLPSSQRDRMFNEAKLLKAYYHFYLLAFYGPICPLRENMPVNESTHGVRVYREKIDDCFAYVLRLIDEVIQSDALPLIIQNETSELGRLTLAVAYFLKAKARVYHASPLFNGNTDYNGFLNEVGEPFFNQTYVPERWTAAAEACREAIDVCERAGIRLFEREDYVQPKRMSDSTLMVQKLRAAISQRWNCELIWGNTSYAVTYDNLQSDCMPRLEQGTSASTRSRFSVPFAHVDRFYSKNGVPIDEDPSFDYDGRFATRVGDREHRFYIQEGETTAAMNFDREARFYSTLGFDRGKWYGNHYNNVPDDDAQALYPKARFGEFSSVFQPGEYNVTGYFVKKLVSIHTTFRDANSVSTEAYPFPDMRFADLLLFYAEALNESKEAPDAEVYGCVDRIRARAGLTGVLESWSRFSNDPDKPKSKSGMRRIIRQERYVELACEGHYYWDARRWKTAIGEQNRLIQGWNVAAAEVDEYYTVTTVYRQQFLFKQYFAPIPESELLANPLLVQNPGW